MAGIVSYGAYVPPTRLPFAVMAGRAALPGEEGPERAVAFHDEDALTLAVTAGVNALRGFDRARVDGLFLASTTQPFAEKQGAALAARALDLRREVRAVDFGGSLRAGFDALAAACDAVRAGSAKRVLVLASDVRPAAPGSALERSFGDGAAALLVGPAEESVARVVGHYAFSDEIVDVWRAAGDAFVHSWEERFVVQEGYTPAALEAVRGLLVRAEAQSGDFDRVALAAPDARSHAGVLRALGVERDRALDPLFGRLGNAGAAFAPLLLVAALEQARAGERVLAVAPGDGGAALALAVTDRAEKLEPRRGVAWHLARRRVVPRYDSFLRARGLDAREYPAAADPGLSATIHFRERDEDLALCGQQCRACGGIQFPIQRVCERCFARDDFERVRLSDRTGNVVTFTFDHFFPTPTPPTIVTVTEIDGARVHLQLANASPEETAIGLPVEFELRCIHRVGGRPNYFWKATPLPGREPEATA